MLPNEAFALACRAYYDEMGLIVDERNGEFAHCPYPEGMGETGYYLLHDHHQHQGILQSKDVDRICFFTGHAKRWLLGCDYWPDNYFELWDIYEEYATKHAKEFVSRSSGIHNSDYRESNEYKSINKLAGKRGGTEGRRRKSGIHSPEYRSSAEYKEMRRKESRKLVERKVGIFDPIFKKMQDKQASKPVIFHYPDGTIKPFPSRMEAIRQTKISASTLVRVLRNGKVIAAGRFKGVRIIEA